MQLTVSILEDLFKNQKETLLSGRWIRLEDIEPIIHYHQKNFTIRQLGVSEQERSIYHIKAGNGQKKILIWSQMHGNESTGTKAVFDLLNTLTLTDHSIVTEILNTCTLHIIPMLNPDGAEVYTRVNANQVDLNRDAVDRQAVESNLLRNFLDDLKPDFCFNLHDQRTIFGVAGSKKPATISFLAPSEEITRALTPGRKETMNVIVAMNQTLQEVIPDAVGLYTDEFYPTATGDNFQKLGYNTILIEAGHYPEDYEREVTRKYNFYALLKGIYHIAVNNTFSDFEAYLTIPNNVKNFYDVIHRYPNNSDVAFQYKECIIDNTLVFDLQQVEENDLNNHLGHEEVFF